MPDAPINLAELKALRERAKNTGGILRHTPEGEHFLNYIEAMSNAMPALLELARAYIRWEAWTHVKYEDLVDWHGEAMDRKASLDAACSRFTLGEDKP